MGSLDVSSAKQQFFQLVDAINASHLPSFTIWLDAKLAEYKTIGQFKLDSEVNQTEQYPEWISKALRQNLSFAFPGRRNSARNSNTDPATPTQNTTRKRSSETVVVGTGAKRRLLVPESSRGESYSAGTDSDEDVRVKEEPEWQPAREAGAQPGVTDPALPGIQSAFSLLIEAAGSLSSEESLSGPHSRNTETSSSVFESKQITASVDSNVSSMTGIVGPLSDGEASSPSSEMEEEGCDAPLSMSVAGDAGVPDAGDAGVLSAAAMAHVGVSEAEVQDAVAKYHAGKPTFAITPDDIWDLRTESGMYACPLCGKESRSISLYKNHFVSHSNERAYQCPYCEKRFGEVSNCYGHQKYVHKDKPRVKVHPRAEVAFE